MQNKQKPLQTCCKTF